MEGTEKDKQFLILKVLNSFSPRPFFFTIPIGKKGSINSFFRLLDSSDRNAKIF
jgi:hypothetical protein